MKIKVMRQIELLGILQEISNYWDSFFGIVGIKRPAYSKYQDETKKCFSRYKEHRAVRQFEDFIKRYGVFTPHNYFLNMHVDFSELFPDEKERVASVLINSCCDPNEAMQMQKSIADFVKVADFEDWFYGNRCLHESLYDSFETCINEYVIRALVLRIFRPIIDNDEYTKRIAKEEEQGFTWIGLFLEALGAYERNPAVCDSFRKYYPMLPGCLWADLENYRRSASV